MSDKINDGGAMEIAKNAEAAVTDTFAAATQKVTDVAQTSGAFDIFGVSLPEVLIIFLILLICYNLVIHGLFWKDIDSEKRPNDKKFRYYTMVCGAVVILSYALGLFSKISVDLLIRILFAMTVWFCIKYMHIFLDKHFARWSQKRFGKRKVAHNMLKDIAKRVLTVLALIVTFFFLKISIVKFFSMEIPGFLIVFVFAPLVVRMNLLAFSSVIKKGFILYDFIQIGLGSDAIVGKCIEVNFSGVLLEMSNGEKIILKLSRVADADVINLSTKHSHRSSMVYYFDIDTGNDGLKFCEDTIRKVVSDHEGRLIQCNFISGAVYRHELKVVFDVEMENVTKAREVMNKVYLDVVKACKDKFAKHSLLAT